MYNGSMYPYSIDFGLKVVRIDFGLKVIRTDFGLKVVHTYIDTLGPR